MFGPKSLEFPRPRTLLGRMFRSSLGLAAIGAVAALAVVTLEGPICTVDAEFTRVFCSSNGEVVRSNAILGVMFGYVAYLLAGPVLHGHNRLLLHSHNTAWVHAVANWVGRLTGGINPMTPGWSDVAQAAIEANHEYNRHNLVTFFLIVAGTILYAVGIFTPWLVADRFSSSWHIEAMIGVLVVVYIFVATTFVWVALCVLAEQAHKEDAAEEA